MKKIYLVVIFSIAVFVFSSSGLAKDSNSADAGFYFVQITDTHLGEADNIERTKTIIKKINVLPVKVEFVVLTGDVFINNIENANMVGAAKAVFAELKPPIYFVAGNHDLNTDSAKAIYINNFGQLNYTEEKNGVFFIFAYVEPLLDNFAGNDAEFFKWFEDALQKAGKQPVIVFCHEPAGLDFYDNSFHRPWPAGAEKKWIDLINSHNVKAVIAGHFHRDEFHWLGNVPMFVCEPVSGWLGRQAAFRVYQYKNGRLEYSTQYLDVH